MEAADTIERHDAVRPGGHLKPVRRHFGVDLDLETELGVIGGIRQASEAGAFRRRNRGRRVVAKELVSPTGPEFMARRRVGGRTHFGVQRADPAPPIKNVERVQSRPFSSR